MEEASMYARVVRFTDVSPDRIAAIAQRVEQQGGPPEGVVSTGFKLLVDDSQSTAIFIGFFETEEDLRKSSEVLEAMDVGDTPGTRASVDMCEVKVEADA
jgi:hypothetical protein